MTQDEAYQHLLSAENCFLTGAAGCGKTFVTNKLIDELGHNVNVAVTATTGIAARNLRGETLHSYLGIGLGRHEDPKTQKLEEWDKFWNRCTYSPYFNRKGIERCECLVIDEISMMSSRFLDDVERLFRLVKGRPEPFGNTKIILCGDALQLPPVSRAVIPPWFFKSSAYKRANVQVLYLDRNYRQTDGEWLGILNQLRVAKLTERSIDRLNELNVDEYPTDFQGVFLMTHRKQAQNYNGEKLSELPGEEKVFYSQCTGKPHRIDALLESLTTPKELRIKVGARVVTTINDRNGCYFNGSLGVVVDWDHTGKFILVEFDESPGDRIEVARFQFSDESRNATGGKATATMSQFPIRLAWACTIHSMQGVTLEKVFIDATNTFTPHQLYVAMSRCKTLEGVTLRGFVKEKVFVDYDAREFYRKHAALSLV